MTGLQQVLYNMAAPRFATGYVIFGNYSDPSAIGSFCVLRVIRLPAELSEAGGTHVSLGLETCLINYTIISRE